MYEDLIAELREEAEWAKDNEWETPIMLSDHLKQAADAIEELANKLCDWCGVCPKERRRPWDCEIMWPNAPIPEVYIEPPKEDE